MEFFRRLAQQLGQVWSRMSTLGRVGLSAAALGAIVLLIAVGLWSTQGDYQVLVSDLSVEDAAAVTASLDAQNITYRLEAGGTRILVPVDQVQRQRMNLAVAGLPSGVGKGFELFDEESALGTTPFHQNLNFLRAIQSELARTIKTLEPIDHVRVHIVQPERTPFVREQKQVTASVVLRPKRGATIDRRITQGIQALVASSVEGLEQENVTVLDTRGRLLSEKKDPMGTGISPDQLEYQRAVESYLASKAQEMLTRVLGFGNAVVQVTADMDFRRVKEISETFDPEERALHHEVSQSSKSEGGATPAGVPGTASNVPPIIQPATAASATSSQEESVESDYYVSKTQRQVDEMVGAIQRLSVAVMLVPPDTEPGQDPTAVELAVTEQQATDLVKNAVGFSETRGDQIQVTTSKPIREVEVTDIGKQLLWEDELKLYITGLAWAAAIVAILAVFGMFWLFLRHRRKQREAEAAAAAEAEAARAADLGNLEEVAQALRRWLETP